MTVLQRKDWLFMQGSSYVAEVFGYMENLQRLSPIRDEWSSSTGVRRKQRRGWKPLKWKRCAPSALWRGWRNSLNFSWKRERNNNKIHNKEGTLIGQFRYSFTDVEHLFQERGYTLLSTELTSGKYRYLCPKHSNKGEQAIRCRVWCCSGTQFNSIYFLNNYCYSARNLRLRVIHWKCCLVA